MAHQAQNAQSATDMPAQIEDQSLAGIEFPYSAVDRARDIKPEQSGQDGNLEVADTAGQHLRDHGVAAPHTAACAISGSGSKR